MKKNVFVLMGTLVPAALLSACVSTDCGPEPSPAYWQPASYVASGSAEAAQADAKTGVEVSGIERSYWEQVQEIVNNALVYPQQGLAHFCEGSPTIRVRIKPDGTILKVDLVHPAGAGYLDKEALDVMQRLGKLPPVPETMRKADDYMFDMPINFQIHRR